VITTTLRHTPEAECEDCDWSQHGLYAREDAKWHAQRNPGHHVTVDVLTRSQYVRTPA
jgi:hypothetical protein